MAGFTAINAPKSGPSSLRSKNIAQADQSVESGNASTTVASSYLGRGNDEMSMHATKQAKKTPAKGKKRTSNAREPQSSKRQRASSVKDDLQVSKAGAASVVEQAASLKPNRKKKRAISKSSQAPSQVSNTIGEPAPTAAKPISVYAQTTSMDALDTTSMRTSLDYVKSIGGSGILYQGPSSSASFSSGIERAKPLWDTQGANHRLEVPNAVVQRRSPRLAVANKTVPAPTPRHGNNVDPSTQHGDCEDEFNDIEPAYLEELANAIDVQRLPPPHHTGDDLPGETCEDEFESIQPADLEELADAIEENNPVKPATPSMRERKLNMRDVEENEDCGGALMSYADKQILNNLKKVAETTTKPIVREPFPTPVLDRGSPIHGASKSVVLRTCFRVGEAMVAGCRGVRSGTNTVLELYARVTSSWREPHPGRKQYFVFKDLYHDRQPHLEGTFELWGQAVLWDLDSKPFLSANEEGNMCRVIARMRRDGQKWRLEVLSIWEASWDDIDHVAGVYAGSTEK